ncbi:NAD(P)/FAD-dependent oxidoreductase [Mucilaginibacter ginsenosidivorans]|uniref:Pyridine nucleotide-disulfide oxidoreductase n=1 Tax=Mucilaginibacter ginsenosidivorans TaxID=398053 RepID=A0A5B8US51_9SPHI|nr:FAD-dependent oxidoreductase [Mucilaginibacter ginsenosidivorans]QEC61854.1 pyridine nucleotide-disulfide oxidoreductase [Mucilaginibacter ginsenosidivorans]
MSKPHILILGCNFAGLTTARYIHARVKDKATITIIDRKSLLTFVPNIPLQVLANVNPALDLQFKYMSFLERDGSEFIQAEVITIDADTNTVVYQPNERPGHPVREISYDYLVIALGNRLAYDMIDGFNEYGHSVTDVFLGNRLRNYLHKDYKGGPIVITSDIFHQGKSDKLPAGLPVALTACEGPPVELSFSIAHWLEKNKKGNASTIFLSTPAKVIAEDAGETILNQLLPMMQGMGYNYKANTLGIKKVYDNGIEFNDGTTQEAELAILFPDWQAHSFLKNLPFTDDQGFVVTDLYMRNPDYPNIFAVGDAASITVPKIGSLGHMEAEVLADTLGQELGAFDGEVKPVEFEILCMGDMGGIKGFYMRTNEWWGGKESHLEMGITPHALKMGFKQMYYTLGGKIPHWGLPVSELVGDNTII